METLKPEEIPEELMKLMRQQFEDQPKIRQLRIAADQKLRKGQYVQAMQLNEKIEELFSVVVLEYLKKAERETKTYSLEASKMPRQDVATCVQLIVTLYMAIDIIDTCIKNVNETLHKTNKDVSLSMFEDINQLTKMIKAKMEFFNRDTTFLKYNYWGDITDNMYEMMKNKAKAIITKTERKERKDE